MRITIGLGDTNDFNIKVVGGPYPGIGHGSSTQWDLLCAYCLNTFRAPTTNFKKSKSCYQCRGKVLRSYSENTTLNYLYSVVKGRKVSKEKGFSLTKECFETISKMSCHYCGSEPALKNGYKDWHMKVKMNGIDRVDPLNGYHENNVVPCCKNCNVAKLDRSEEEFIQWARKLVEFQSKTM
jgi:hypothetical protein